MSAALEHRLLQGLPPATGWTADAVEAAVLRCVDGAASVDVLGAAPRLWLTRLTDRGVDWRAQLSDLERTAMEQRVLDDVPWRMVARACGTRSVPTVQRAVRRALRRLWDTHGLET